MRDERERRGLNDLVNVSVVVTLTLVRAFFPSRRLQEVVHASGQLVLTHDVRNRDGPVRFETRTPEIVRETDGAQRDGSNRVVTTGLSTAILFARRQTAAQGERQRCDPENPAFHRRFSNVI